jgi:serine-type D-Ala-D-Ala carboxypeptidase/endopeptidase (penicillin-binding protein 4)
MVLCRLNTYCVVLLVFLMSACAGPKKSATTTTDLQVLLSDSAIRSAHLGIMVVEAETGKTLMAHQPHQYFVPASNTKLWTMYAGMKYLGSRLVAGTIWPLQDSSILFRSNADPTFLHPDYPEQPLKNELAKYKTVLWQNGTMRTTLYGNGWSWNDYDVVYMAPRSSLPMFGNVASFRLQNGKVITEKSVAGTFVTNPDIDSLTKGFDVFRSFDRPHFTIIPGRQKNLEAGLYLSAEANAQLAAAYFGNTWKMEPGSNTTLSPQIIYSQPADSMLKPLMHRSDNFFAEQTLLMISNQWFGYMDEDAVIDSLLKKDLKGLPDKPRWVDGSGLSRYNLFTPADYIWLLQKMQKEFPMSRLQTILPTGNDGTLTNYYKPLEGKIFAKTGTLAGVVALSGYLTAKSGKLLLFSTLVNNHNGSAVAVRRAVEKYLLAVYEKY